MYRKANHLIGQSSYVSTATDKFTNMTPTGSILLIDSDQDDQAFYSSILRELVPTTPIMPLNSAPEVIDYLCGTDQKPFLIICELILSGTSGLELRQQIEADPALRKRAIPFVFMTHPVYRQQVEAAYELTIQGLFEKQSTVAAVQRQLRSIISYWQDCLHLNRFAEA